MTTAASISALVTGALVWRRWGAAVYLREAGLARRPGGLGLSFAF